MRMRSLVRKLRQGNVGRYATHSLQARELMRLSHSPLCRSPFAHCIRSNRTPNLFVYGHPTTSSACGIFPRVPALRLMRNLSMKTFQESHHISSEKHYLALFIHFCS